MTAFAIKTPPAFGKRKLKPGRYVWWNGKWTAIDNRARVIAKHTGIKVIRDIDPYRSVIDRSVIGGRRQHRDHLRDHGCVEIGTEKMKPMPDKPLPPIEPDLKRAFEEIRSR